MARGVISKQASGLSGLKVIDVSDQPLKSNVVRQGKQVPAVEIDQKIVDTFVTADVLVTPTLAPRVVSQSIAPGIKVAKGMSVDLVLAPRITIPIEIIKGVHEGFAGRNVGNVVDNLLGQPEVANAVLDFDEPEQVPAASRAAIEQALSANDIGIVADDPKRDFNAAFRTLKGAAAFK
ncbi:MAG: hypothetical protein ACRED5_07740 [Propylenella sp.]